MKKYLIAITMLLTLATTTQAAAQRHRHSAAVTATAPAAVPDSAGIEAFSDTTSIAEEDSLGTTYTMQPNVQVNLSPIDLNNFFGGIDWDDVAGMFFIVCIVAIVFLLSPVLIIALIFYFINQNRKETLRLAQMAIQKGRPIPESIIREQPASYEPNIRSGIREVFLGIGLMILLHMILGKLGFGIGALVFFIGLGKLVIALLDRQHSGRKNYVPPTRPTPPPVNSEDTPTDSNTDNK
jgi:hypothetical protein